MNDYWNNPPEEPDPPECCGETMDVNQKGQAICAKCQKIIDPIEDYAPDAFADVELPDDL